MGWYSSVPKRMLTCCFAFLAARISATAAAASDGGALERYPPVTSTLQAWVDNFDPSRNDTFNQKYLTFDRWWQTGGPILLYLGNEGSIEGFYNYTGAMFEHAQALGALVVFVEHRYYGSSLPYGKNPKAHELRGLTVEQAMADYAWFLQRFKESRGCGQSQCPVVTFGGSYGGMLVAWFRQKYPQLTVGGVGAGAVIDFYAHDGRQKAFWKVTRNTFQNFGLPGCANALDTALATVSAQAASPDGRKELQKHLQSCDSLEEEPTAGAKIDFFARGVLSSLAMLDYTEASAFVTHLPANPVAVACKGVLDRSESVSALRYVLDLYLNATGGFRCYDFLAEMVGRPTAGTLLGPTVAPDMGPWQYQACTELPMQTLASDGFGFYVASDDQLTQVAAACRLRYGVTPRPGWLPLSLGGSDLRVGSLFFTDGEKDPWGAGSIKMSRVKKGLDIQHMLVKGAAHHEDLRFDSAPPRQEVQRAKRLAREAMQRWIEASSQDEAAPMVLV